MRINPKYPERSQITVIVILLLHLAYFLYSHVLMAPLFMGYAHERESSLGEPAWPTYVWGITQFAAAILFVLTLYLVMKKSSKCLVTASAAGIGGYLLSQAYVLFQFRGDLPFLDLEPQTLLAWGLPMIAVFLNYVVGWRDLS